MILKVNLIVIQFIAFGYVLTKYKLNKECKQLILLTNRSDSRWRIGITQYSCPVSYVYIMYCYTSLRWFICQMLIRTYIFMFIMIIMVIIIITLIYSKTPYRQRFRVAQYVLISYSYLIWIDRSLYSLLCVYLNPSFNVSVIGRTHVSSYHCWLTGW